MNFLNIRYKLLFLFIVPTLLTLLLFFMILLQSLSEKNNFELTKGYILESIAISKVVHAMQTERGVSSGFLAKNELDMQDTKLLLARDALNKALDDAKYIYLKKQLKDKTILNLLNELDATRKDMDLKSKSISYIKEYYSQKIELLLNYVATIPTFMDDRENRNFVQALVYLSNAKESLGIIRATLNKVFIENELTGYDNSTVEQFLKNYNRNISAFKNSISGQFLNEFEELFKGKSIDNTFAIIELTMANANNKEDFATNPDYWFDEASQTINLLNDVENALFHDISNIIDEKLNAIFYKLALIVILSTIGIIALMSITLNFVKNILASTTKLNEEFSNSQSLLEQYKSSVDRSFIVSKTDKHGIITYVNDEFCKISGYSRDELLGKSHNIIRHPDVDAGVFKEMWHTIKDKKEPWFGKIQNRAKDKTVYWTKAIINPILDSNQNIIEYIGIRTDVTELENAMIAALSAEKAKSLFLATMSHELRTPLNAVIGFSQILMAKSDMPQENIRLFVEKIHASGKHLLNIVNNILDFSKIESGKIELNKKDIYLEDLIKDTILLLENEALKKEIKITTDYFSNITINCDEQLLKQVILNILSNAIKFSNQNSTVALSYEEDEKNHIIKICDSGVGLSQEQIEKLFLPFSQIQEHQNSAIKGTGLGLVISQKIAKLHNGVIEVTSQEAKGSCFYLKLPITKAQNE